MLNFLWPELAGIDERTADLTAPISGRGGEQDVVDEGDDDDDDEEEDDDDDGDTAAPAAAAAAKTCIDDGLTVGKIKREDGAVAEAVELADVSGGCKADAALNR